MQRFFGVLTSVALLVTSATPVFASSGSSSTHYHDGGTKIDDTSGPYTITLSYPKHEGVVDKEYYKFNKNSCFGAYQIFSGEVKGEEYTGDNANPGNRNEKIPITDIKWGNAFGIVDREDSDGIKEKERECNILGFVYALATASTGTYSYAFSDFTEFKDFFTGYTLSSAYTTGSGTVTVKIENGKVTEITKSSDDTKVNFDKLAVAVADIIAQKTDREWLQEFTDILGGFAQNPDGEGYLNPSYVNRFYEGSIKTDDETKYEIKVPAGYYMIRDLSTIDESESGDRSHAFSARMLFVANNVEQELKVDVPTLEKNVLRDGDKEYETEAAGVGDIVHFQLKGTLPSNYDLYVGGYQYTFIDTLSDGLDLVQYADSHADYDSDTSTYVQVTAEGLYKWTDGKWVWTPDAKETISVKVVDHSTGINEDSPHLKDNGNNYTATYDKEHHKLTVAFPCLKEIRIKNGDTVYSLGYDAKSLKSSEIYVDYYAKVNQNAVVSPAESSTNRNGNYNEAQIEYSDNPQSYDDTDYTTVDRATVYVFGLDIVKVDAADFLRNDGDATKSALEGAEFALVRPVKGSDNSVTGWEIAHFGDLIKGTDVNLPATFKDPGYYPITGWEKITIPTDASDKTKFDPKWLDEDGNKTFKADAYNIATLKDGILNISGLDVDVTYTMVETTAPANYATIPPFTITLTAQKDGDEYTGKLDKAESDQNVKDGASFSFDNPVDITDPFAAGDGGDDGSAHILVANFKYIDLPSTGGVGTYLFYIIGGGIIVLSAVLFILSKKKTTK